MKANTTPDPIEAEKHFKKFMECLGLDLSNSHLKDTPRRVTQAFLEDIFKGLYSPPPKVTLFDNSEQYSGIVFQGNIKINSTCAHHFLPFQGKAHIAYIPGDKYIGLSKLNRIAEHFSKRPQVQEDLTQQIHDELSTLLEGNLGVAVMIEAGHTCVSCRGINQDSTMKTARLSGVFLENDKGQREEFYHFINQLN